MWCGNPDVATAANRWEPNFCHDPSRPELHPSIPGVVKSTPPTTEGHFYHYEPHVSTSGGPPPPEGNTEPVGAPPSQQGPNPPQPNPPPAPPQQQQQPPPGGTHHPNTLLAAMNQGGPVGHGDPSLVSMMNPHHGNPMGGMPPHHQPPPPQQGGHPGHPGQPPQPMVGGTTGVRCCAGCGVKILDRFLLHALDRYWHNSCLKCSCCQATLADIGSSCFTKAGMILCKNDYIRLFGTSGACSACGQMIPASEFVMRAQNNVYHLKCFTCVKCHNQLVPGDRYNLVNGSVLCEQDCLKMLKGSVSPANVRKGKVRVNAAIKV